MSGTDAPGAGMMQLRSGASGAIGGGEPIGGAPGPAEYQYGQPGPGQPRGEFDMLAAGGMATPGYGGPGLPDAGGAGGIVPPSPQGQPLQDGQGPDLMQLGIALRDIAKLSPDEMGATVASMPDNALAEIERGIPGMDLQTLPDNLLMNLRDEIMKRRGGRQ